ncbi:MAG TPA: transporter associated domain-containing protein [Actinomycetes bacterium]|nr:transporter associated domain-containing protein [Actinomycetes bacterium]
MTRPSAPDDRNGGPTETQQRAGHARREPDGSVVLPGSFPMHDLADLGISLPEGPYATVAGLALQRFGRVPSVGEAIEE